MTANVRCVGKALIDQARGLVFPGRPPCGWTATTDTHRRGSCPECGGRVELITERGHDG
jgi:RNA 3'-terminal phosphate cyclase